MVNRTSLLDAVRWLATDKEWEAFEAWRLRPVEPFLRVDGTHAPGQQLAEELLGRCISKLKAGEWIGFGAWGRGHSIEEIDPAHWQSKRYAVGYNELGYDAGGEVGFSSICVEEVPNNSAVVAPKAVTRSVLRKWMKSWCDGHPGERITCSDLRALAKVDFAANGGAHEITKTLFAELFKNDFPTERKLRGRPKKES